MTCHPPQQCSRLTLCRPTKPAAAAARCCARHASRPLRPPVGGCGPHETLGDAMRPTRETTFLRQCVRLSCTLFTPSRLTVLTSLPSHRLPSQKTIAAAVAARAAPSTCDTEQSIMRINPRKREHAARRPHCWVLMKVGSRVEHRGGFHIASQERGIRGPCCNIGRLRLVSAPSPAQNAVTVLRCAARMFRTIPRAT